MPPLRERPEDIPALVEAFVNEFSVKMGRKIKIVARETMNELQRYNWPGNLRKLRNLIEHAVIIEWRSREDPCRHIQSEGCFLVLSSMELASRRPEMHVVDVPDANGLEMIRALRVGGMERTAQ